MIFCRNIRRQLSALLDDELSEKTRRKVKAHLQKCSGCEERIEILRRNNYSLKSHYFNLERRAPKIQAEDEVYSILDTTYKATLENRPANTRTFSIKPLFKKIGNSVNHFIGENSEIDIESVSSSGAVGYSKITRLALAFAAALGILLLHAPKLNGF
jgi:predicted anti-sigma-YlaC factor YlaD